MSPKQPKPTERSSGPDPWSLPAGYGTEVFEERVQHAIGDEHAALLAELGEAQRALLLELGGPGFALLDRLVSAWSAMAVAREATVATVAYRQGIRAGSGRRRPGDPRRGWR